jgi:hypothetical protein
MQRHWTAYIEPVLAFAILVVVALLFWKYYD